LSEASYLRLQAQRCRRLARGIPNREVVKTLLDYAAELEARAAALEAERDPNDKAC